LKPIGGGVGCCVLVRFAFFVWRFVVCVLFSVFCGELVLAFSVFPDEGDRVDFGFSFLAFFVEFFEDF
jgi:hypothetical protein